MTSYFIPWDRASDSKFRACSSTMLRVINVCMYVCMYVMGRRMGMALCSLPAPVDVDTGQAT